LRPFYTTPTGKIFEPAGDTNPAEKLIKALGEFIQPVIKGLETITVSA
jgi:hypothetical protein